jgi:multiple sugar transport system permease protein
VKARAVLSRGGIILALAVFAATAIGPFVWLALSSLLQQQALISSPPNLAPASFTLDNYREVLGSAALLGKGLANSLVVAGFTTFLAVLVGAPAAYALARLEVRNQDAWLLLILAAQMFPAIVIVIPLFIAAAKLGLIDTRVNLILVYLSFNLPVVIWVLRGFFIGLPRDLERAARVDGASILQTFGWIVLPISLPALFAAGSFAFIEAWNEFFFALIMTRQSAQTVPLVISSFAGQYQTIFGQMMAAAAVSIAPIVLLTILLRSTILRGFADGLLKG